MSDELTQSKPKGRFAAKIVSMCYVDERFHKVVTKLYHCSIASCLDSKWRVAVKTLGDLEYYVLII